MFNRNNLSSRDIVEGLLNRPSFSAQEAHSIAHLLEQTGSTPQMDMLYANPMKTAFALIQLGYIKTIPEQRVISEAALEGKRLCLTIQGKQAVLNAIRLPYEDVVERVAERNPIDKLKEKLSAYNEQGISELEDLEARQVSEAKMERAKRGWLGGLFR